MDANELMVINRALNELRNRVEDLDNDFFILSKRTTKLKDEIDALANSIRSFPIVGRLNESSKDQ